MSRYLVTGANGFVGRRLCRAITSRGDSCAKLVRKSMGEVDTYSWDIELDELPKDSLSDVNTIVHLAGLAHDFLDARKIKERYWKINVDGSLKLAKAALGCGVDTFIYVSSVKADGVGEGVYGQTKREAEVALLELTKDSSMKLVIVRPSLVYGPNVKGNLEKLMRAIQMGWFPPLPETGNKRSMVHVDDLVDILLLVGSSDVDGKIITATDGTPYSARVIYKSLCQAQGITPWHWSVPYILFKFGMKLHPKIRYSLDKIFGDELYSCKNLDSLGYKSKRKLLDINQTIY
jgi:UDP-glucose 4-epimerase